jgi:hypothetical protein
MGTLRAPVGTAVLVHGISMAGDEFFASGCGEAGRTEACRSIATRTCVVEVPAARWGLSVSVA